MPAFTSVKKGDGFSLEKKTMTIAYGFSIAFVACTLIFVFTTTGHTTPLFNTFLKASFSSSSSTTATTTTTDRRQQLLISQPTNTTLPTNWSSEEGSKKDHEKYPPESNTTSQRSPPVQFSKNPSMDEILDINATPVMESRSPFDGIQTIPKTGKPKNRKPLTPKKRRDKWFRKLSRCNILEGKWVKDDSYPLYKPGSCPYIDESFDCFLNGRPDNRYERFRWQPNDCNIPRLNGKFMLELLRGKRLVYVGDSLNRNMWESMLCILRNSVENKSRVFEASGLIEFRTEDSFSFVFEDYNCSVEFFQSPFLVQEWEMPGTNGHTKETLRLDMFQSSSDKYKDAEVLVFNTGHWWTHEKTSTGKGYYQEGSYIYDELGVEEAFRKAMRTLTRWVENNIDPKKTLVIFRGYSASHFSGGRWNSGGQCNNETEPISDENYVGEYPPIMGIYESVIKESNVPIYSLNITRMTDFRKDAHPSIYRELNITLDDKISQLTIQDCSHWCLPGVPDTWNELVYTQLVLQHYRQKHKHRMRQRVKRTNLQNLRIARELSRKRLTARQEPTS